MSRLDSFIRRMSAQRDCLDRAAAVIADVPGVVLELGLGNGRTYDHLRELLPDREIYVFDRRIAAHPDCIPDRRHMILGDVRETLPAAGERVPAPAALVHTDVGTGDEAANLEQARWLGPTLQPLLAPGAVVVSDQPMGVDGWDELELPAGVPERRYFMYRKR